jgi:molybdenum cofactor sulfurtransferase
MEVVAKPARVAKPTSERALARLDDAPDADAELMWHSRVAGIALREASARGGAAAAAPPPCPAAAPAALALAWVLAFFASFVEWLSQRRRYVGRVLRGTAIDKLPLPPGYNAGVGAIRAAEFRRLGTLVHADYAGAPPFSERAAAEAAAELAAVPLLHPHSAPAGATAAALEALRMETLALCGADPSEYVCVLTGGATAALRLVAEAYPWAPGARCLALADNHSSAAGVARAAAARGAHAASVAPRRLALSGAFSGDEEENYSSSEEEDESEEEEGGAERDARRARARPPEHLFIYPLESNFDGARYAPALAAAVRRRRVRVLPEGGEDAEGAAGVRLARGRWRVLVDAARAAAHAPPDLAAHPTDYVALSYYKLFGAPTGLGALVVRRGGALRALLRGRAYRGGGAAAAPAGAPARLEDGTPPFLAAPSACAGFRFLARLGGPAAAGAHAAAVAARCAAALGALRHGGGAPAVALCGGWAAGAGGAGAEVVTGQGATVAFRVLRPDGAPVGHGHVARAATAAGVALRTGALCNPGAAAAACGLGAADAAALRAAARGGCWDEVEVWRGRPTGVARASFGYASTLADADAVAALVHRHFVVAEAPAEAAPAAEAAAESPSTGAATVEEIFVYPIKACPGFAAPRWPLGAAGGLAHDRRWALAGPDGAPLAPRRCPGLFALRPRVNLAAGELVVESARAPGPPLRVPLAPSGGGKTGARARLCVRGGANFVGAGGAEADAWLSAALGQPCRLVERGAAGGAAAGFANEGDVLVVAAASLEALRARLAAAGAALGAAPRGALAARFRPNLIVAAPGGAAGAEQAWARAALGGTAFAGAGGCPRCERVCRDPETGAPAGEQPLLALAQAARVGGGARGRPCFGVLLNRVAGGGADSGGAPGWVEVGSELTYEL